MIHFIRKRHVTFSLFLTVLFSIYSFGCTIYGRKTLPSSEAVNLAGKPMVFYVLDVNQPTKLAWRIKANIAKPSGLEGTLVRLSEQEAKDVNTFKGSRHAKEHFRDIMLYTNSSYTQTLLDSIHTTVPFSEVQRVEVYEKDKGSSAATTVVMVIGIAALVFLIVALIAVAAKGSSCPFIYSDNPEGPVFEGELYSGATYPQLERHDWLPLLQTKPNGDKYHLRLSNQVHEIQNTNLLELVAVDHPEGAMVLYDKYGQLHTMTNLQSPAIATDLEQRDVMETITAEDNRYFMGNLDNQDPKAEEGLLLTFRRPPGAQQAKLVIRAKNSMWLDHVYGLLLDEQGERAVEVRQRMMQKSADELRQMSLQQNIPLSVWLEIAPGRWERLDYFQLPGPMAFKRDVLPLDLSRVQGDHIRIKLSTGFLFWEIDYAAMDYSQDQPVSIRLLPVVTAIDRQGQNQTAALRSDDASYYVQPNVGDEVEITFQAPPIREAGTQRTLLLHSKGHYQILHESAPGKPKMRHLRKFTKPDTFSQFSREKWREVVRQGQIPLTQ